MSPSESVTQWIRTLRDARPDTDAAVRCLYERYFHRLIAVARHKLEGIPGARVSAEEVASHAFSSFCVRLIDPKRGFERLESRDDLWRLLARIVVHKALKAVRHHSAQARDFRREMSLSARSGGEAGESPADADVEADDLPPDLHAEMSEEVERRRASLPSESLRRVARARLEGHSVAEIAAMLDVAPHTVERKLHRIREIWEGAEQ
jgi:RNA polymerase sigma factor (sigma-70 family)